MAIGYPEHKHPHGIGKPKPFRILICSECDKIFSDDEIRNDEEQKLWGHSCKSLMRCMSHLEAYVPDPPKDLPNPLKEVRDGRF